MEMFSLQLYHYFLYLFYKLFYCFVQTRVWEINEEGLTQLNEIKLPNTVLSLAYHTPYIAMGTTNIQVVDSTNYEWRRIVADDVNEDESLEVKWRGRERDYCYIFY